MRSKYNGTTTATPDHQSVIPIRNYGKNENHYFLYPFDFWNQIICKTVKSIFLPVLFTGSTAFQCIVLLVFILWVTFGNSGAGKHTLLLLWRAWIFLRYGFNNVQEPLLRDLCSWWLDGVILTLRSSPPASSTGCLDCISQWITPKWLLFLWNHVEMMKHCPVSI